MKKTFLKSIALVLSLVLSLGMLSGCGKQEEPNMDVLVDTAVKAALDATVTTTSVTIEADGKFVTIEDAEGMNLQQLLALAKVTLNDGDILSFDPAQIIGSNMTVKVLRVCHVTVTVVAEDSAQNVSYQTVLLGGTVADAIESVGLKLAKNQTTNYKLEEALSNNMEILISAAGEKKAEEKPEETQPTEPEATEDESYEEDWSDDDWSDDDWSDDDWSDDDWYDDDWSDDDWSDDDWSDDDWYEPEPEPDPEPSGRYVVSEDVYYDCDGSGHGVKVITYSDGTQEEVYF